MQHGFEFVAFVDVLQEIEHAAFDRDMQDEHGHAAEEWTSSMDMTMQHGNG